MVRWSSSTREFHNNPTTTPQQPHKNCLRCAGCACVHAYMVDIREHKISTENTTAMAGFNKIFSQQQSTQITKTNHHVCVTHHHACMQAQQRSFIVPQVHHHHEQCPRQVLYYPLRISYNTTSRPQAPPRLHGRSSGAIGCKDIHSIRISNTKAYMHAPTVLSRSCRYMHAVGFRLSSGGVFVYEAQHLCEASYRIYVVHSSQTYRG